jgi:hypothetical protein
VAFKNEGFNYVIDIKQSAHLRQTILPQNSRDALITARRKCTNGRKECPS